MATPSLPLTPTAPTSKPASWQDVVSAIAKKQGVNPQLALALVSRESGFDPEAVGDAGKAVGMFQLHEAAAADMGLAPDDRHDPIKNITAGIGYLKRQSDLFGGDVSKALMAYNGGASHVQAGTMSPEAQAYASDVIARMSKGVRQQAIVDVGGHARRPDTAPAVLPGDAGPPLASHDPNLLGPRRVRLGSILQTLAEPFDPRTPEGRTNLTATAAAGAASIFGPEGPAVAPWLIRVLGPAAAAAIASGTERAVEQNLGTAPKTMPGGLETGLLQGAYEFGGQAVMWPIRRAFKSIIAPKISKFAAEGMQAETKAAKAGVTAARDVSKVLVESTEDLGAAATADARRLAASKIVDADLHNGRAILAIQRDYDNLLMNAPDPVTGVSQVRSVLEGPAKQALKTAGERIAAAAKSGPVINMTPVKAELARMTNKAKPPSLYPPQASRAVGFGKGGVRITPTAAEAAEMKTMTQAELRAFAQEQFSKTAEERLPLSGILDVMQRAPDQLAFEDAHALKRLLDENLNWDVPAQKINDQLTKGIRTTLREALAVHEPYNVATGAYRALQTLYRKGAGAKLSQELINNPDEVARMLNAENPIAAQSLYDLLVTQAAAGGNPVGGQQAWDAVRSQYVYNTLLKKGGIQGLKSRVEDLGIGHSQFTKTVFADQSGMQILSNLHTLGDAYERAVMGQELGNTLTKTAGKDLVSATKLAVKQQVRAARAAGQSGTDQAKAALTAAQGAEEAFAKSSLAKYPSRTPEQVGADVLRATGAVPGWQSLSIARLLHSPASADLLQYIAYSPRLTQLTTKALLGQLPDRAVAGLIRDLGTAIVPAAPSHTVGKPATPASPAATAVR